MHLIMNHYSKYNILVIGDSCTDVFTYGNNFRLAPEGPAPVFNPIYTKSNGGMALNVNANIEAIGAKSTLITQDEEIVKTRYVDERTNSLLLRVDTNDKASRINKSLVEQIKSNKFDDVEYQAIVISDYCKGFLTEEDIEKISLNNHSVFLDTKKVLGDWCKNCDYIKINHLEFDRTKHTIDKIDLYNNLIITHSDKGCEYQGEMHPVERVNCKDMSGAGDTFISGLVCEWVRTKDISSAINFAQQCATGVVQKLGVCTI
jgi:bifunctional ADP-heptose synthase (sugar kinase/adenylyltransferase)